jgi:hypothetical protein
MRGRVETTEVRFADEDLRVGAFANAFRLTPDTDGECFLDFCVYSPSEDCACIVARVRVRNDFVPVIVDRLAEGLRDISHHRFVPVDSDGDAEN